jgi:predicted Zn-dependent protease
MGPMKRLRIPLLQLLAAFLIPTIVVTPVTAQTMGAMDTHARWTVPTEKEELITKGSCSAFQQRSVPEALAICNRLDGLIRENRWGEARGLADGLTRQYPKNGLGYFWLGTIDLRRGKIMDGVRFLETAADRNPEVLLAHINLGLGYSKAQRGDLFEKEMRWVIRNHPEDPLPYYYLGRYYSEKLEKSDESIWYFRQALNRNANSYKSRFHLGLTYEMNGEFEKAKAEYELAVALVSSQNATYAYPLCGLARISWQQQNRSDALCYAQKAVHLDPDLASSRLILGNLYLQMEEPERALTELKAAAELDASDPAPHYMLARAYRRLKMPAEAQREEEVFSRLKASCQDKPWSP